MRGRRGSAVMLALVALALAASVSAVVLERGVALQRATEADATELRAYYAARGALEEARHRLAKDPSWSGGEIRIGGIAVRVTVGKRLLLAVAGKGPVRLEERR